MRSVPAGIRRDGEGGNHVATRAGIDRRLGTARKQKTRSRSIQKNDWRNLGIRWRAALPFCVGFNV
jgi:hypothetical protein